MESFCCRAKDCGIDGIILPDLPVQEYEQKYRECFKKYGLHMIFLITPQTPEERIQRIASASSGFLYLVSAASTTGMRKGFGEDQLAYFKKVREMDLGLPRMIGFGISSRESFRTACQYADGAIIGSAFMKRLSREGDLSGNISSFLQMIR
jgi:tryptophan synthase alpha chain